MAVVQQQQQHRQQIRLFAAAAPAAAAQNKRAAPAAAKAPVVFNIPVRHVNVVAINQQHPQLQPQQHHHQQQPLQKQNSEEISLGDYVYNPNELLGRGAFGAVYRGYDKRDRTHNTPVAIKVVAKRNMPLAVTKEARIHQQLQHENLVRLLQVRDTPTHLFLIMEYCTGDLSELLPSSPLAYYANSAILASRENFLRDIVQQLAAGLQALKAKGIVHRDLKPQNILTNIHSGRSPLQIKIADFGVSRFLPCGAMAATFCGTVAYMAPEVMLGQPYDCRADVWSLGIIVFQMLTGKMPFPQVDELSLHGLKQFYATIGGLSHSSIPRGTSPNLSSMLCKLIKCSANERITLEKLIEHPFLTGGAAVRRQSASPSSASASPNSSPSSSMVVVNNNNGVGGAPKKVQIVHVNHHVVVSPQVSDEQQQQHFQEKKIAYKHYYKMLQNN